MSCFKRLDSPSASLHYGETSLYKPKPFLPFSSFLDEPDHLDLALDILSPPIPLDLPIPCLHPYGAPSTVDFFEAAADLIQIGSWSGGYAAALQRQQERVETEFALRSLSDRVAALEAGFDRALLSHHTPIPGDRKYKWTAEVKGDGDGDRKYKWVAEAKAGGERSVKWTAEVKGRGQDARTYTLHASTAPARAAAGVKKVEAAEKVKKGAKECKGSTTTTRVVEITDGADQRAVVLRQAFAKGTVSMGKRKELSPQDAALLIQMCYREHLVRRSQVLRGLRDLAVAKVKLREIRAMFSNFSYRRHVATEADERQRFSEKIIVLLLTVDAIEGPDYMVRAAKKSMVDELDMMLEIVDPQPPEKLSFLKRRRFDLPTCGVSCERALGVADVV